jgi:hypothetical protein
MFKTLAIASALIIAGAAGAQAAEVGVRHSSGGSRTNTHSGRQWSDYSGSRLEQSTFEGQSSKVRRGNNGNGNNGNGNGNNGNGNAFGRGRNRTSSSYEGSTRTVDNYSGGSRSSFSGSDWSDFSETSTFAR